MPIHDPTRLHPSSFDRIAERLVQHYASKKDIEEEKAKEIPAFHPEVIEDHLEDNLRVKVAAVSEIPSDFRHLGAGLYRQAHSLWELRTAEDDGGGYVLVRKFDERAVDMRQDSPNVGLLEGKIGEKVKVGSSVVVPHRGKFAQAIVISINPQQDSAQIDLGLGGGLQNRPVDELEVIEEEEMAPGKILDPGHPELADLGPMDGIPGKGQELKEDGGEDGGEEIEKESEAQTSPSASASSTSSAWNIGDAPGPSRGSDSDGLRSARSTRQSRMTRVSQDFSIANDEEGYDSLPGGMGVTVSDVPYTPSTRRPSSPPPKEMGPALHSSQPGDRAPMGRLLTEDELAHTYRNFPSDKRPLNQKSYQPLPRGNGGVSTQPITDVTVPGRPPQASEEAIILSPTVNRPARLASVWARIRQRLQ